SQTSLAHGTSSRLVCPAWRRPDRHRSRPRRPTGASHLPTPVTLKPLECQASSEAPALPVPPPGEMAGVRGPISRLDDGLAPPVTARPDLSRSPPCGLLLRRPMVQDGASTEGWEVILSH